MNFYNYKYKYILHIVIIIKFVFLSTLHAKNIDDFNKIGNISNYFNGILLFNENQYDESYNFFKKLDGLEEAHSNFSKKYLYSLVNSGNFLKAFKYSKKLEKQNLYSFESFLISGIYYLKNSKFELANQYFLKAKEESSRSILNRYVAHSFHLWSNLSKFNIKEATLVFNGLDERFTNLKKIQNVFLNCFYSSSDTEKLFEKLVSNKETDFSRYNYFYANYLISTNKNESAIKIINNSLKSYPRNLILNQYKIDLNNSKNNLDFNCKNIDHVLAELLYITANALSSQSVYTASNFYLNLAKYLNEDLHTLYILLAENFYKTGDYISAKKIYKDLSYFGSTFKWYSTKQISKILIFEKNQSKSVNLLHDTYKNLPNKNIYQTFDLAEFLKNNEKFTESIKYYTEVLNKIDTTHSLYPEAKDGRGVAYERIGEWDKAENDFLSSLEISPDQAYVINYLAYSWIEKGKNIEKSLKMLEKANKLKSNDPYIIDSLGWALFKLKRYDESKNYLQLAVRLMPADPIVNDHFGDALWKIGNKIQARYYWNYVLNLEKAEKDLKEKIKNKLIKGL